MDRLTTANDGLEDRCHQEINDRNGIQRRNLPIFAALKSSHHNEILQSVAGLSNQLFPRSSILSCSCYAIHFFWMKYRDIDEAAKRVNCSRWGNE